MTKQELFSIIQVLIGAVVMLVSIGISLPIRANVPSKIRRKWQIVIVLMMFFFIGYLLFVANLVMAKLIPLELVTGTVFLGGALFVYIVVNISRTTIYDIRSKNQELEVEIEQRKQRDQERKRQIEGLKTLDRCTRLLLQTTDDESLFVRRLCESVQELVQADLVLLPLVNPAGDAFTYQGAIGWNAENFIGSTIDINDAGLCGMVFKTGQTFCIPSFRDTTNQECSMARSLGLMSGLSAPLLHEGLVIGGLTALRLHTSFDEIDSELLTLFSQRASVVFDNIKLLLTLENRVQERTSEVASQKTFLQSVIDGVVDPTMVIGTDYRVMLMNSAAKSSLSDAFRDRSELFCHQVSHRIDHPCSGDEHPCPLEQVKITGETVTMVHRHRLSSGELRSFELQASPLWNDDGTLKAIIESGRDITERLAAEQKLIEKQNSLDFLAHHDPLTDLPNRLLLHDRLRHAMAASRRSGRSLVLLFLDLDRFKNINDSLGHETGDLILKEVAQRLTVCLRETDTVARIGGDEFVIILEQLSHPYDANTVANKILESLARPIPVSGNELFITTSIGICFYPEDAESSEELLKFADAAMYSAKELGRNNFQFYKPEMNSNIQTRLIMEGKLRRALENSQFVLYYQPQVDMRSGKITGVEALIRWLPPEGGMVPPNDFIPLAEESGLILPIGEWVLQEACRQGSLWQKMGIPVTVAVNISARQFRQTHFISTVEQVLRETGFDPLLLELELTETCAMENVETTLQTLKALQKLGVQFAIDDFGTGYCSLSYLKQFPISKLKIDRSFVSDAVTDANDAAIVASVVALGRSMGMDVIAEGVETEEHVALLLKMGCHNAQGYLYGRPLPLALVEPMLQQNFKNIVESGCL